MKKILLLIAACSVNAIFAQDIKPCATDEVMNEWFKQNPSAKIEFLKRQQQAKSLDSIAYLDGYKNVSAKMNAAPIFTIPVVFHVLHTGGSENISDAQLQDAITVLNRDYQKMNADTVSVITQFKNNIGDVRIQFALATKDPSGNCTTGITRHNDKNTDWTRNLNDFIYSWPRHMYLNIYVVKTITNGAAGYTYLGGGAPTIASDAIVVLSTYVGSIGTSNAFKSRTLTHEVGHWLNLPHVWGGNNNAGVACGDEGVADTPITKGYLSCPSGAPASMICNAGVAENYQNYMDYSYCTHMFTNGQVNRMHNLLNSSTAGRNNLWANSNLIATGIINPMGPCAPIADMYSSSGSITNLYTICANQNLTFNDASYNGTITSRTWSGTGSPVIGNPTASSTTFNWSTPGVHTVSLTVSNATGSSTTTKTVNVLTNVANFNYVYPESFEAPGLPSNWTIINQTGGVTWQQYFGAAASGNGSYYMNNSINPNNAIDILETPSYDFLNNSGATFTFKYAYAQYNSSNADVFKVQASSNCGGTWQDVYIPTNAILASGSGGTTTTPFYPTASQYKLYTLTSHPAFNVFKTQPNVRIRFYFMEDPNAGFGNNLFLDDINFNTVTGVNDLTRSIGFNVFPNPTSNSAKIVFTLSNDAIVNYNITDITGRIIEASQSLSMNAGEHSISINEESKLMSGIYLVNFELNGQKMSRKLIVE